VRKNLFFGVVLFFYFVCTSCQIGGKNPQNDLQIEARDLAQRIMILDTHIDIPYGVTRDSLTRFINAPDGQFDYNRARQGGLNLAFLAVYVPPAYLDSSNARDFTDDKLDLLYDVVKTWPGKFKMIFSPAHMSPTPDPSIIHIALGIENGTALQGDLANLKHFYDRGIRYITLVHSKNNRICDSSLDAVKKWHGVSTFGKQVIEEMNRLGIMVDVSHASDESFFQIVKYSRAPVMASHSGCRYFTPGFERNLSDSMIQIIADKGGVVQIPVGSFFLSSDFHRISQIMQNEMAHYLAENHISENDPAAQQFEKELKARYQVDRGDVTDVVDHIEHVIKLVGIDYVGIGSDFEGVSILPCGIESVADYPNIILELLKRGYSEKDIRKIFGENLIRVWKQTEKVAKEL
jgi:membrane dipeptidase